MVEVSGSRSAQATNADALYGAVNKYISDTGFEFAMVDGRIDDGEWMQIAAKAGLAGVDVNTLVSLKARYEQSWAQEHKDGPLQSEGKDNLAKGSGIALEEATEILPPDASPSMQGNSKTRTR